MVRVGSLGDPPRWPNRSLAHDCHIHPRHRHVEPMHDKYGFLEQRRMCRCRGTVATNVDVMRGGIAATMEADTMIPDPLRILTRQVARASPRLTTTLWDTLSTWSPESGSQQMCGRFATPPFLSWRKSTAVSSHRLRWQPQNTKQSPPAIEPNIAAQSAVGRKGARA